MNELAQIKSTESWNTPEKLDIIKNQLTKDLSSTEFLLFIEIAKSTGLNPLTRQIYAVKRGNQMTIQTGIDGYRSIAMRSGMHLGTCSGIFQMKDEKFPISAKVIVKKLVKGSIAEFEATAYWNEYAQMFGGKLGNMWQQYPKVMLEKCAEALALRRAFPEETALTYIDEEINPSVNLNTNVVKSRDVSSEKTLEEKTNLLNHLSEQAEEKSKKGTIALKQWFENELTKEEKLIIKPKIPSFKEIAEQYDKVDEKYNKEIDKFDSELENVDMETGEIL